MVSIKNISLWWGVKFCYYDEELKEFSAYELIKNLQSSILKEFTDKRFKVPRAAN